jgi:putative acetyltransferase
MTAAARSAAEVLHFVVREETPDDIEPIDAVTRAAFRDHPFSHQTEHLIVRGLREAGALKLALVATMAGRVVGHVAFSPVTIGAQDPAWCGLGPVSVMPAQQRSGIGSSLIRSGLRRLRKRGVAGCVVLGDPAYYTVSALHRTPDWSIRARQPATSWHWRWKASCRSAT